VELPFRDRTEAGRILGAELANSQPMADPLVIALLRGGLPVALEVASALNAPLDVLVVRKLGVPWQPELAFGAIAGDTRVLDDDVIRELDLGPHEMERVIQAESEELQRREKLYDSRLRDTELRGRDVILVDDGLATGSTMIAAVRHLRSRTPRRVLVAVPVSSKEAVSLLRREADGCLSLAMPHPFLSVGQWYEDFRQISDSDVRNILRTARQGS
jgi:putative phosphoribosyl transferase